MKQGETHSRRQSVSQADRLAWPQANLQELGVCPVCGAKERELLYRDLTDNVYRVAPGKWTLFRCRNCRCGYLDPRPTAASIGRAYQSYFTHEPRRPQQSLDSLNWFRRLRRSLAYGYVNRRYGSCYAPASAWGPIVARCLPWQRERLDIWFRWLPKPEKGARLLDVGCGNGAFLVTARDAGWDVVGVEPDPLAAKRAREEGITLYTDLDELRGQRFDAVTLSHVIEHVHQPGDLLRSIHRLLRPHGLLYIDTPNLDSEGFRIFGRHWRGLEAPRHLQVFSGRGMRLILRGAGFTVEKVLRRTAVVSHIYQKSQAIHDEEEGIEDISPVRRPAGKSGLSVIFRPVERLEFITLMARTAP